MYHQRPTTIYLTKYGCVKYFKDDEIYCVTQSSRKYEHYHPDNWIVKVVASKMKWIISKYNTMCCSMC